MESMEPLKFINKMIKFLMYILYIILIVNLIEHANFRSYRLRNFVLIFRNYLMINSFFYESLESYHTYNTKYRINHTIKSGTHVYINRRS